MGRTHKNEVLAVEQTVRDAAEKDRVPGTRFDSWIPRYYCTPFKKIWRIPEAMIAD